MDLWPNLDNVSKIETPKKILEKQGQYLSDKTNAIVYAACEEALSEQEKGYEFKYRYYIASKKMKNYRFMLFTIYHNVTLYPLLIVVESQIASEINLRKKSVVSKEEFEEALRVIFRSKVIESVIGTLINI